MTDRKIKLLEKNKYLIGQVFGRLTILEIYYKINPSENKNRLFCKCSCSCSSEKIVNIMYNKIQTKNTLSCGCIKKERGKFWTENRRKKNEYKTLGNDVYVKFNNCDKEFIIDHDDLCKIEDYGWYNDNGYVKARVNNKNIKLHRIIINAKKGDIVDHKDGNTYNNKKENLRITNYLNNRINSKKRKDNTSGIIGVYKVGNSWCSSISKDGKRITKNFKTFNDAVYDRLLKEKEYFGEFAPQKHLFEKYRIE